MYDLKTIKEIPCEEVSSNYGIKLKKKGVRYWGRLRDNDKTPSFSINTSVNLWYDFGLGEGGSVIDLVIYIENISSKGAINKLAHMYNIRSVNSSSSKSSSNNKYGWHPLSHSDYKKIGVNPYLVPANFNFDFLNSKYPIDKLKYWSIKYDMSIIELSSKFPKVYNRLIYLVCSKHIKNLRNSYFDKINRYKLNENNNKDLYYGLAYELSLKIDESIYLYNKAIIPRYSSIVENLHNLKISFNMDIS